MREEARAKVLLPRGCNGCRESNRKVLARATTDNLEGSTTALNPFLQILLSNCSSPDGFCQDFTCGEISGIEQCGGGGGTPCPQAQCDFCCAAVALIIGFKATCLVLELVYNFRLCWGGSLPQPINQWVIQIAPKLIPNQWQNQVLTGCFFEEFSNYCLVTTGATGCVNCNGQPDCCCGECMATCDDLIDKLTETNNAIMCLAQKVDCVLEVIGQSWMDRTYTANHYANLERILVNNTNQLAQGLIAIAQGVSEVGIPIPELPPETTLDPLENTELGCAGPSPDFCASVPPP